MTSDTHNDNKKTRKTRGTETTESSDVVLNEKTEVTTYKFSRTLTIGGLVVSVILLIVILILVYMYFCK